MLTTGSPTFHTGSLAFRWKWACWEMVLTWSLSLALTSPPSIVPLNPLCSSSLNRLSPFLSKAVALAVPLPEMLFPPICTWLAHPVIRITRHLIHSLYLITQPKVDLQLLLHVTLLISLVFFLVMFPYTFPSTRICNVRAEPGLIALHYLPRAQNHAWHRTGPQSIFDDWVNIEMTFLSKRILLPF